MGPPPVGECSTCSRLWSAPCLCMLSTWKVCTRGRIFTHRRTHMHTSVHRHALCAQQGFGKEEEIRQGLIGHKKFGSLFL